MVPVLEGQGLTKNRQAHIHRDEIAAFTHLQKFGMLESVTQLGEKLLFHLKLLGLPMVNGGIRNLSTLGLLARQGLLLLLLLVHAITRVIVVV